MTEPASGDSAVDRRVALAREWDELVAQVQKMEGFEDFLKPPKLRSLLPAADHGPVVIVNVTDWRSDALIVRPDGATSLRLESLTLHEATEWANGYLSVLRAAELVDLQHVQAHVPLPDATPRSAARRQLAASRELEKAHARVDEMLRKLQVWMWDVIAEPVLDALGFTCVPDGSTSTWPRVWWCPTGPLTLLPLHTAGHHRDLAGGRHAPRTVLDRVVSSYTPTLRALLEAQGMTAIGKRRRSRTSTGC
nr:hypothetical protein OG296_05105 [Streptomyces sp. NBC_01001]